MTDTPLRVSFGSGRTVQLAAGHQDALEWRGPVCSEQAVSRLLCVRFCTKPGGQQWKGGKVCSQPLPGPQRGGTLPGQEQSGSWQGPPSLPWSFGWTPSKKSQPLLLLGSAPLHGFLSQRAVPCPLLRHPVAADTGTREGHR